MIKQFIFGCIFIFVCVNINFLLDFVEDLQKMIDQLVCDYMNSIVDVEFVIVEIIGNLCLFECDYEEDVQVLIEWGNKVFVVSCKVDEMCVLGNIVDVDKFDNFVKIVFQCQISVECEVIGVELQIVVQIEIVDKFKSGLNGMKDKFVEFKNKCSELFVCVKVVEVQIKVQDVVGLINVFDFISELGCFEDKVCWQEVIVQGKIEFVVLSFDVQFESLEDFGELIEVEVCFVELKVGGNVFCQVIEGF